MVALVVMAWIYSLWSTVLQPRLTSVQSTTTSDLPCLSYAPFRRPGATPFDLQFNVTAEQIREDLIAIAPLSRCIRTYGLASGLDQVPAIARELGLKVKLGVWLGRDDQLNNIELSRAVILSQQYSDVIDLIIVGNEVLLRKEMNATQLRQWLLRAKQSISLPVSYADVWEFWLSNDALRDAVDVITIHILPYWEDEPVSIDHAIDHVWSIYQKVALHFSEKPVFIGETGWPSQGRQRAGAVASLANQQRFVQDLSLKMKQAALPLNFIEAIDQPWKRALEGRTGGYWGLLDFQAQRKSSSNEYTTMLAWLLTASAVLGFLLVFAVSRIRTRNTLMNHSVPLIGGFWGALYMTPVVMWSFTQAQVIEASLLNKQDSVIAWATLVLAVVWALVCLIFLAYRQDQEPYRLIPIHNIRLNNLRSLNQPGAWIGSLQFFILCLSARHCLLLAFDGRYREIEPELFSLFALGIFTLRLSLNKSVRLNQLIFTLRSTPLEAAVIIIIALASVVLLINEGFRNAQINQLLLAVWTMAFVTGLSQTKLISPHQSSQNKRKRSQASGV